MSSPLKRIKRIKGRPTKLSQDIIDAIEEYINESQEDKIIYIKDEEGNIVKTEHRKPFAPIKEGLFYKLGVHKTTFYDWRTKAYQEFEEHKKGLNENFLDSILGQFYDVLVKWENAIGFDVATGAMAKQYDSKVAAMVLSNTTDYKDESKQAIEHSFSNLTKNEISMAHSSCEAFEELMKQEKNKITQ